MANKVCVVPSCSNNSRDTPNKIFIFVPQKSERRLRWAQALNVDDLKYGSRYVVCEDHFDLEKDASNWMYYKTVGDRLIMKPEVVPHKSLNAASTTS